MTIVNQTSKPINLSVQRNNGTSYQTTIPAGGSWAAPADTVAALVVD